MECPPAKLGAHHTTRPAGASSAVFSPAPPARSPAVQNSSVLTGAFRDATLPPFGASSIEQSLPCGSRGALSNRRTAAFPLPRLDTFVGRGVIPRQPCLGGGGRGKDLIFATLLSPSPRPRASRGR